MISYDKTAAWPIAGDGAQTVARPENAQRTDGNLHRFFNVLDESVERVPAWIFHSIGALTALIALWFALAFLGGLPGGPVEWLVLAMFGAFAYSLGFLVPLVLVCLLSHARRFMLMAMAGGAAMALAALAAPLLA